MEAVGRLAGGVAHDFNNLITVIGGFAETLDGTFDADDPRQEAVLSIREAASRASGLTRQLLSFSRRAPIELTTLDVHEVVLDTVHLLERVIGEKIRVSLALHAAKHHIRADAGQFKQVLLNLVLNARDAMPNGGDLRIVTRKASPQTLRDLNLDATRQGYLELEVTDTGVGMTSDTMARVFEPFFTTKGPEKGTGLGLSTVYGIVSQIGGQVTVSSLLERGSTFRVIVPASAAPSGKSRDDHEATAFPGEMATLLVAEDEDGVRLLVTRILRAQGHRVLEVSSGTDAMRVVETHDGPIDLLVTDVVMGDFGGRTLADAARVVRPQLRVLYMSGYPDEDNLLDVENPTESFLKKPFTVEALKTRVDLLLRTAVNTARGE
jgi:CheY-like chemotaxis protein